MSPIRGVKVLVVEPSGFRTDWAGSSMTVHDVPEAYAATVGAMSTCLRQGGAGPTDGAVRAAEFLARVAKRRDVPEHLPVGAYAAEASIAQDRRLLD
ncbi:hypothetical protein ACFVFS_00035 [Kitasatospora sp. NPDC057692]|uniref:hypothetical protein n=1 Tax=Kitasatospora sp. NPDC057692 TaxID=3346215 RepID=UPI003683EBAB